MNKEKRVCWPAAYITLAIIFLFIGGFFIGGICVLAQDSPFWAVLCLIFTLVILVLCSEIIRLNAKELYEK